MDVRKALYKIQYPITHKKTPTQTKKTTAIKKVMGRNFLKVIKNVPSKT